jgi:hypothetical protein
MMMIRKYRSSLPASLAAYHSLSAVLRDTLFCFTDFQLIGPPFIIITQCQCIANYEPGRFGGLEIGVSCVATCGPGNKGTQGTCTACETGTFKSTVGTACTFCPGMRTASRAGAQSVSKCSCTVKQMGIKKDNMTIVESLGAWDVSDTLLQTAQVGAELLYEPSVGSARIWKLVQLNALAISQVRAWAAQGRLWPGFAVFRSTNVFDESACSECPRGLVCKEFIAS